MSEPTAVAEAFSRHRFADVATSLADDVIWVLVGGYEVRGRDAVVDLCEQSARELADVTTTWESFRVIDAGATVVVESWATYASAGGEVSRVASCDVYDFVNRRVQRITSFTVEVSPGPELSSDQ